MIGAEVVRSLSLTFALAAAVTAVHRRLPPRLAARYAVVVLTMFALAAFPTVLLLGLAFLTHAPFLESHLHWLHDVEQHDGMPWWLGGAAALWLPFAAVRIGRVVHQHGRLRCRHTGPLLVTSDAEPYAVTMPGPGGRIVVSRGLLDHLDHREAEVVLAHERAHARHRHDRYLLLGGVVAAALPPLRWLATRLEFSVERWADEAAAAECSDRRLVARTLGKVALLGVPASAPTEAGFARLGVLERIQLLLAPAPPVPPPKRRWALRVATAVTGGLTVHQMSLLSPLLTMLHH